MGRRGGRVAREKRRVSEKGKAERLDAGKARKRDAEEGRRRAEAPREVVGFLGVRMLRGIRSVDEEWQTLQVPLGLSYRSRKRKWCT